ncbi:reverse transcriptase domain, reverse transcriptase zinc-binding domain protein [Tanacetum coccineum]
MHNYHRKRGPPRCAFKVDIQKAYDTVDWRFLRSILVGFGFHLTMVEWIMVIIDALEEFKNVSGLVLSILKSTAFFCYVLNALKASILSSMPFSEGEMKKGKAKVAWEAVYLPHCEGRLRIRRLDDFNVTFMTTHVWCIVINKESLWVQWIHSYKLKGRSFWDVPCLGNINNGRSTSMWFDRWADSCPLRDMLTVRNIVHSDFSLSNTVSDLVSNGSWRWPHDWSARFPNVVNIRVPDFTNGLDDLRADVVDWYHVVWFPHCIPRHALHMWLVIKEKLKTQDRLRQWDVGPNIDLNLLRCPLCELVPDSHSHLFFECSFASQVWFQVRAFTGMSSVPPRFVDVLAFLILSKGSSLSNVISRIVLATMTYCLWNERNSRLFKKKKSIAD